MQCPLLANFPEGRWKQPVLLGVESYLCLEYKCQIHNYKITQRDSHNFLNPNVSETWTLSPQTKTLLLGILPVPPLSDSETIWKTIYWTFYCNLSFLKPFCSANEISKKSLLHSKHVMKKSLDHTLKKWFKSRQQLDVGQEFLQENNHQDVSKMQTLQRRHFGPFTATERIINTTYQIRDDNDTTITKTQHCNHLIENCSKEETLTALIGENVPMDRRHGDVYERFMEQAVKKLNTPEHSSVEDSLPVFFKPWRNVPKRSVSNTSSYSGVKSPRTLSFSPAQ